MVSQVKAWIDRFIPRVISNEIIPGANKTEQNVGMPDAKINQVGYNLSELLKLGIKDRHNLINALRIPRQSGIVGSRLKFHVETITEDARVRKFKEPWTIDWLRSLPQGAVLYDVGANIGITALTATEDATKCIKVVAIEPAPANYCSLVRNIHQNRMADRVVALPIGLGEVTDVSSFNLTTLDAGGALHTFGDVVTLPTKEGRLDQVVASNFVLRYRMDDMVTKQGMPFPSHIKVDVDGTELEVLNGASCILKDERCKGVQVESVDNNPAFDQLRSIVDLMHKHGFSKVAEYPHNKDFPRVTDLQFARK